VSDSTRVLIIFILAIIVFLALAFLGSNFMARRAIKSLIKMFRNGQALTPETARTTEELGMKPRRMLQLKAFRDYKPAALQFLMRHNIIQATEDGRFFLSEEALSQTNIERRVGGPRA
jgi:uncharacterized protein YneF (UPF0154 family)